MIDNTTAMTQATASVEPVSSADPALNTTTAAAQSAAAAYPVSPGWPGPSWPQVQPTLKIAAGSVPDGRGEPHVVFNAAGTRAIVMQPHYDFWTWDTLYWNAPDLAALVLLILWLWIIIRTVRSIRMRHNPRIVGHWYCRKCGYDLTPVGTNLSSRTLPSGLVSVCSECGVPTAKRRPLRAHTPAPTLFRPFAAAVIVSIGAVTVLWLTLDRASRFTGRWETLWPSPTLVYILADYTGLPLLQRSVPEYRMPDGQNVRVYDLPSGRLLSHAHLDTTWCQWLPVSNSPLMCGYLQTITGIVSVGVIDTDAAAPTVRIHSVPSKGRFFPVADSHTASSLYFSELARGDGTEWSAFADPVPRPTAEIVLRVWRLDPKSGAWTRLAEKPVALERKIPLHPGFLITWVEPGESPASFTLVHVRPVQPRKTAPIPLQVHRLQDGVWQENQIIAPPETAVEGFDPSSNGTVARVQVIRAGVYLPAKLDLQTSVLTFDPPQTWAVRTPDGLLSFEYPAMPPRFVDPAGNVVAVPCIGPHACFPTFDAGGRWAWTSQPDPWPPRFFADLVGYRIPRGRTIALWDLEALKAPLREKMCGPWKDASEKANAADDPKRPQ